VEEFKFPYVRRISSFKISNVLNSKSFWLMMNWSLKNLFQTDGELIITLPRQYLHQKTEKFIFGLSKC